MNVYLDDGVVLAVLLQPFLDELDHDPDEPDDGDDERAEGERAEMVAEGAPRAQRQRRRRDVLLVEGPVPGREGAGHDQLLEGGEEKEAPQQHEEVEQLVKKAPC